MGRESENEALPAWVPFHTDSLHLKLLCKGLSFTFVQLEADMPQGTIKKLVADRGFGFIEGDRGELFFHHSEVNGVTFEELSEGQTVEYEIGEGRKGPCATAVRVVG